ncbi:hypothetical protein HanHA300_Chr14g0528381 [Helianthus annuus]|nr:hypothetical protein HanHA300_Chr14g0528381 [Helianthus annuus]KAJ0656661.1 hypothetical protein HanLR1_Chr14g0538481 [Helianthus annuus]KAJ0660262.1 hypothetical protein HanOQP8_Chr14g0535861 [Helianthus annuus]
MLLYGDRKNKMKRSEEEASEALPPPPPVVPPGVVPAKVHGSNRTPMARRGSGTRGQKIPLLANHFNVKLSSTSDHFYQYSVSLLLLYIVSYILLVYHQLLHNKLILICSCFTSSVMQYITVKMKQCCQLVI